MAIKTQGSALYTALPILDSNLEPTGNYEVVEVECILSYNGGGNPKDNIETTCLGDTTRKYVGGLRTPGQSSFPVNADPSKESHVRMFEACESDDPAYTDLVFAYGWADGSGVPTVTVDSDGKVDFSLPQTRSWFKCRGYISDFPFDAQANTVVQSAITVQRSGRGWLYPKGA